MITKLWEWKDANKLEHLELLQYLSGVIAQSNFDESKVVAASQSAFREADPGGGQGVM